MGRKGRSPVVLRSSDLVRQLPSPTLSNGALRPACTESRGPAEGQRTAAASAPGLLGVSRWTDRARLVNPFLGRWMCGRFLLLSGCTLLCLAF